MSFASTSGELSTADDYSSLESPRVLLVPMHPGLQYHFCRVGLPTYLLGHWDQFKYWRPQPPNIRNLLPRFEDLHLSFGPDDYRRLLDEMDADDGRFDVAWLHFPWQAKLFLDCKGPPRIYFAAKEDELSLPEWEQILDRPDFRVCSYYPRTTQWLRETFNVRVSEIELGLDPDEYAGWSGTERRILTVIHSWSIRGWNYPSYLDATAGLPTIHVDHLDRSKPVVKYDQLRELYRTSRIYLHDGEREYTIALLEALMTGMPIVSFDLPGIERYVTHGVNGFVGRTSNEIKDYCQLLLDDDDLATAFGSASRALALANHHEERWRRDWRSLLATAA